MSEMNNVEKFKNFLKELFRIDLQDLDFGIYKIMKIKQDMILKFIDEDLVHIVKSNIIGFPEQDQNLFADVFNLSYEFLSRYYSNGDFIPQIRYGGRDKYMIPYNGQEIELHWATRNSYYVKTTEYFINYSFAVSDLLNTDVKYKVNFRIKDANLDKNFVASERKYFFIDEDPIILHDGEVDILFNFRPIREEEKEVYQGNESTIRDLVKQKAEKAILKSVPKELRELISGNTTEKGKERSIIRRHIDIYFKKNDSDYFIVKNLRAFLNSELDNFIKNEILSVDIEFRVPDRKRYLAKSISTLCRKIIEQISLIEDFERELWEKKKFVYGVNYVITLDRISNKENGIEIIKKLLNHREIENQIKEWKNIGIVDGNFNLNSILERNLNEECLNKNYKFLPIDTKYFKDLEPNIIFLFENLDSELDGWLIHSENYQALNSFLHKFKEKVQTIYIDPPFNKEQNADYLYNVKYKDSTWATILENRISTAKHLLNNTGSIFVRCDHNGNWIVRPLMKEIFGDENFRNEISVRRFKKNVMEREIKKLPAGLDTIVIYSKSESFSYTNPFKQKSEKREGFWRHMGDSSGQGTKKIFFGKELVPPPQKHWKYSQEKIDNMIAAGKLILECRNCGYIHNKANARWNGCPNCSSDDPQPKYWVEEREDEVLDSNWSDIYGYSTTWKFPTENSEDLIKRVLESTSNEDDLVIDFFLGSGTTTAVAHKLGIKWLGVEMGEHFYTVVLPRMKLVLAFDKTGITKEDDVKDKYNANNAGGFFKYYDLEQYEDSLNNIKIRELKNYDKLKPYLIEYILKYGTSGSMVFINKDMLSDPFNVKMKIVQGGVEQEVTIDLIETFNLWYGVNIDKILTIYNNNRQYVFVKGKKDKQRVIIIWRNTKNLDYIAEKDFIHDTLRKTFIFEGDSEEYNQVLINNDFALNLSDYSIEVRSLDPIFYNLQWGVGTIAE